MPRPARWSLQSRLSLRAHQVKIFTCSNEHSKTARRICRSSVQDLFLPADIADGFRNLDELEALLTKTLKGSTTALRGAATSSGMPATDPARMQRAQPPEADLAGDRNSKSEVLAACMPGSRGEVLTKLQRPNYHVIHGLCRPGDRVARPTPQRRG